MLRLVHFTVHIYMYVCVYFVYVETGVFPVHIYMYVFFAVCCDWCISLYIFMCMCLLYVETGALL